MKLGDVIYHSKRSVNDDIVTYAEPTKYYLHFKYLTIQPATVALNNMSGFYTTEEFGEHQAIGWNGIADGDLFHGVFGVGDLLWLDGKDVEEDANAIITSVRVQNKVIFLTIKKLEGE